MATIAHPEVEEDLTTSSALDQVWQTVVWNDPVNLMSYVAHIFQSYFGFPAHTAQRLMLAVHNDGHAVVAEGAREHMEVHVSAMHEYGLWATVRKAPQ